MDNWVGLSHYVFIQHEVKPESKTTKCFMFHPQIYCTIIHYLRKVLRVTKKRRKLIKNQKLV